MMASSAARDALKSAYRLTGERAGQTFMMQKSVGFHLPSRVTGLNSKRGGTKTL